MTVVFDTNGNAAHVTITSQKAWLTEIDELKQRVAALEQTQQR